jgi:general secretion pathway protein G
MSKTLMKIKKTNGFTLIEILVVMVIIGVLTSIAIASFTGTQKKSRDAQRKSDLRQIGISLESYYNDKKIYPLGIGGKIYGCGAAGICSWGGSWTDVKGTVYMVKLPADPTSGNEYYYVSDGTKYQIYARLENDLDKDIPKVQGQTATYTATDCGTLECNYAAFSSNTSAGTAAPAGGGSKGGGSEDCGIVGCPGE